MAEITPLHPDDPDVQAVREAIRVSRRQLAWRLAAAGAALAICGAIAFWRAGYVHQAVAGDAATSTLTSMVVAAAGLAAILGLGLVGTAAFVLLKTRPGARSG